MDEDAALGLESSKPKDVSDENTFLCTHALRTDLGWTDEAWDAANGEAETPEQRDLHEAPSPDV